MGCYGRRGPRVSQFGGVAQWAVERTRYQVPVAVTADLRKVCRMLDKLLPLVSPRDSVVLVHVIDESLEDIIAGETEDIEQLTGDLASLLWNKRGLSHRVRVESTGRPPEHATETVVQRIIKVAEEEVS
ncbi:unnamed protein product, partial [Laminaria digitata]